ncbi:metal-dependent hydrolase [Halobium palmae]|uniref:Metal-dependent hydrolase n=1 Tax=Halobium palmae TaxID=1776492 RepID=A0ABD5RVR9_9EURY
MWPWGHLAVAYLSYVGWTTRRSDRRQTPSGVLAVAFGSQFPDLIDKPLAWSLALLPSGRSLGHSLLTAAVVIAIVYWLGRRVDLADAPIAFAIGYLTHVLVDLHPETIWGLVRGDASQLVWASYLLWPALPAPPYQNDSSFLVHILALRPDPYVVVQFALFGVAVAVWIASGTPGAGAVRRRVRRRLVGESSEH